MKKFSPNPKVYGGSPSALSREVVTDRQVRWDENTIRWGGDMDNDSFPMRLLMAINQSSTAISCLGKVESFIRGSGFTDEGLMTIVVDSEGTTFWDLHSKICQYFAVLDSYSVNFKFNHNQKITSTFNLGVETLRFERPQDEKSRKINCIKHNPYFGTAEYTPKLTTPYPIFDLDTIKEEINAGIVTGQIYFFGTVRPPYKFYPVPKYWSAKDDIYTDANIPLLNRNNLDNGFFQSALINVIGDPNQKSKNPKYMKEITQTDGSKKLVPHKTIGEEFDDQMNASFSGARKAGTAMVIWSINENQAVKVSAFPVNSNIEETSGTRLDAMRGICTATEVPAVLANLPQQASSLGSDGNAIKAAIELMQTNVAGRQQNLENFYNTVMLPNLATRTSARVKIKNYVPIQTQVTVEDKFWEVLSPEEKKTFVKNHVPGMENVVQETPVVEGQEVETEQEKSLNENLKNMTGRQQQQVARIARQFAKGTLTFDQAKLQLKNGFGFDDEDVNIWLGVNEEI